MDALTEVLSALEVRSSLFCRAELSAPWAVHTRGLESGMFHAVVRGQCWIRPDGREPIALATGDLALLPRGDPHAMSDTRGRRPRPISQLVSEDPDACTGLLEIDGGGAPTTLLCGAFEVAESAAYSLAAMLPPVIVVRADRSDVTDWLSASLRLIAAEVDGNREGVGVVLSRMADVLVVHAFRAYIESGEPEIGWLRGLGDPQIARALAEIHGRPGEPWTADALARKTGMSRSRFFTRFVELVGDRPARYLTRWRMHIAARSLVEGKTLAEVAANVGYATEAAFARAFKRVIGASPGAYRRAASQ